MSGRIQRRLDRADTKRLLVRAKAEQSARRISGDWPPWVRQEVPPGAVGGHTWSRAIHTAYHNEVYAVLVRTVETAWGPVEHASIHTLAGGDIPWSAKQRIKNELFGPDRVAVEVFPAVAELVDETDVYHLWVLPAGMALPFTIYGRHA